MAGMARAMGTTLTGAQKLLGKNYKFYLQFLEPLYFCTPYNHKLQSCINTVRPYLMYEVGRSSPAPPRIMTKLWYCDITQRSDIVTEQELSHAISTRHRTSHAIRKAKSVRTAALQARRH